MKNLLKRILLMVILFSVFLRPISIIAAEINDDFIEVPSGQIDIKSSSSGSINTLAEPSLDACDLGIGICSNGLGIEFTTRATVIASEIGVKDIVLQEKTLLGWKDLSVRDHYEYDSDYYTGSVVYLKAQAGKTYRVYCTHYAIIDGDEYTLYNYTDSIVYN